MPGSKPFPGGGGYAWSLVHSGLDILGGITGVWGMAGEGAGIPEDGWVYQGVGMTWYIPPPWYCHLVMATEAGSTHPTRKLSYWSCFELHMTPQKSANKSSLFQCVKDN